MIPEADSLEESRQIKDMKFIRIKVKEFNVASDDLIQKIEAKPFSLFVDIPLPDVTHKCLSAQKITLSNYDMVRNNLFAFNSLSLYNFRIDENTLG